MIIIVFCSGYWTAERSDAKLFRLHSIRVHKCIEGSKSFNFLNFARSFAATLKMVIAQPKTFSIRLFKKWEVPSGRTCQSDKVKIIRTGLNSVDRSASIKNMCSVVVRPLLRLKFFAEMKQFYRPCPGPMPPLLFRSISVQRDFLLRTDSMKHETTCKKIIGCTEMRCCSW